MSLKAIRKFTFDDFFDFEAKPPPPPIEDLAPPPTFSDAELAEAREEGYRAGCAAALDQSDRSDQRRLVVAAERIAETVQAMAATEALRAHELRVVTLNVAIAALGRMLPDLMRRVGPAEIQALIGEIVAERPEEPRLVARVPDGAIDPLSRQIDGFAQERGFTGRLILVVDPALGPADVQIEWADGGVERHAERTLADIRQMLARLSALAASASLTDDTVADRSSHSGSRSSNP
jgi:flagellar assembly protein FliH